MKIYIITLLLSFSAWFLIHWGMSLEEAEVINESFYWGLILLIIGASFYIGQTGFLQKFFGGFKRLSQLIIPHSRAQERADKRIAEDFEWRDWKEVWLDRCKLIFLAAGGGSILYSIILLWLLS